jgi:iron complex transport system substrate-binding protein
MKNIFFLLFLIFISCNSETKSLSNEKSLSTETIDYAKNFEIHYFENYTKLKVRNPWQGADNVEYNYILSSSHKIKNSIKTPIQKAIVLSTTHIGLIDFVGESDKIIGVSGLDFVNNAKIIYNATQKKVHDVGYGVNLNYELLLKLKPDVVFVYGVNAETKAQIDKLNDLGINAVIIAEYLEETPLAQAEWVKFMACFFEKSTETSQKFDEIAKTYQDLKKLASNVSTKPSVMANLPYNGIWYVAGGKSFPATLLKDAGANYIWKHISSSEAVPMSIEKVILAAENADFWINSGNVNSLEQISNVDERVGNLKALKNKNIYNNNKICSPKGGNDYFESGICNPHILLKDLISILHPELLPNYEPRYYYRLN